MTRYEVRTDGVARGRADRSDALRALGGGVMGYRLRMTRYGIGHDRWLAGDCETFTSEVGEAATWADPRSAEAVRRDLGVLGWFLRVEVEAA